MVKRAEKGVRFARWRIFFPRAGAARWKRTFRDVAARGNAGVTCSDISECCLELRWMRAVTYDSAARIVSLSKKENPGLEIVGHPSGFTESQERPQSASDAAAPAESAPAPTGPGNDPAGAGPLEGKRRRLRMKTTPRECGAGKIASTSAPAPGQSDQSALAAASLPPPVPLRLMALKSEAAVAEFQGAGRRPEQSPKFAVQWEAKLGKGSYATVYAGVALAKDFRPVAVKIHTDAINFDEEVKRHAAASAHPDIVSLLDVGLFRRSPRGPAYLGLVFERFDVDAWHFLQKRALTVSGIRHVVNIVVSALAFLHDFGLVHADVKPGNILLRGVGRYQKSWRDFFIGPAAGSAAASASSAAASSSAASGVDVPLEVSYQSPAAFQAAGNKDAPLSLSVPQFSSPSSGRGGSNEIARRCAPGRPEMASRRPKRPPRRPWTVPLEPASSMARGGRNHGFSLSRWNMLCSLFELSPMQHTPLYIYMEI